MRAWAYGFPRLGKKREYKKSIEDFWRGSIPPEGLKQSLNDLQVEILTMYDRFVDCYPVGEMTAYDQMLDTAIMLGLHRPADVSGYYCLCRGKHALEMTKWFNTNYHYLVPDFSDVNPDDLHLFWNKPLEFLSRFEQGTPYLIGPFTFLKLSKGISDEKFSGFLAAAGDVYREVLDGLTSVHIDEPAFVLDLEDRDISHIKTLYSNMAESGCDIDLFTYYDSVDNLSALYDLKVRSIGLDFVHGTGNLEQIKQHGFPDDKTLIAGIVDGRNVWCTDIPRATKLLEQLSLSARNLGVSNAAPLFHVPITLSGESLDERLRRRLAFAAEKLEELRLITRVIGGENIPADLGDKDFRVKSDVRDRVSHLSESDFTREVDYTRRSRIQDEALGLPLFPTTTIGSFPQTPQIRKMRSAFKSGSLSHEEYRSFIREKIDEALEQQETLGLDVLVHGEFERSDMVEFFAEKLAGIATTRQGWIISYGTRGYRPPIIFGDVSRPKPLTIDEISYAQSRTKKPVKGMLTGPVTIIAWSFVREDIPVRDVAYQISLALRDEIGDLEKAGIRIVQVDEPAYRESAPNKKKDWDSYFDWAIKAFRLATGGANPETQIHSHMCYSEFGEIIERIVEMDFDVISIEATRSRGDVLKSFEGIDFDRKIGLGVWDIHSPSVPDEAEIETVIRRALEVIPKENFWINPDCGLKTRKWEETGASLKNLVSTARRLREE